MHPIITQAIYYAVFGVITTLAISFIFQGFFWKYIKVRTSFGKLLLVKIRAINRDFWEVGQIEENFLVFKSHKEEKRIALDSNAPFYRLMHITVIDVKESDNSIIKTTGENVTGFDASKFSNLFVRALYKPTLNNNAQRIMFVLIIATILAVAVVGIICWQNYGNTSKLITMLAGRTNIVPAPI